MSPLHEFLWSFKNYIYIYIYIFLKSISSTRAFPTKQTANSWFRCFSPGREKFKQLFEFKKRLDQQHNVTPPTHTHTSGPSRSTSSSPKTGTIRSISILPPRNMLPPSFTVSKSKKGLIPTFVAVRISSHQTTSTTSNDVYRTTDYNRHSPVSSFNTKETAAEFIYRQ